MRQNDVMGAIWKYSMPEHIHTVHPGYSMDGLDPSLVPIPSDMMSTVFISQEEETMIGIPADKIPRKEYKPDEAQKSISVAGRRSGTKRRRITDNSEQDGAGSVGEGSRSKRHRQST